MRVTCEGRWYYVTLLLLGMWQLPPSPLRTAAFCAIGFVLLHFGVVYALRNISLSLFFAATNPLFCPDTSRFFGRLAV